MTNPNDTLPDNIKQLIEHMSPISAIPLTKIEGIPFLAIKVTQEDAKEFKKNGITAELKPSIFNVELDGVNTAICFIQLRLNRSANHIYNAIYNLKFDKHFEDCFDILQMSEYGVFIATDTTHEFIKFTIDFEADFDLRNIIAGARDRADEVDEDIFKQVQYAFTSQASNQAELWSFLAKIAPYEQQYYASFKLDKQKV